MEHVSTLCTLSTVGIAATGFGLGRRERDLLSSSVVGRRDTTSRCIKSHAGFVTTEVPASHTTRGDHTHTNSRGQFIEDSRPTSRVPSQRRRERRRRQTYTTSPLQIPGDLPSQTNSGRPSSSWLRRISVISSNTDSPLSSPRPTSHGSIAPIIPQADQQPSKAPNKLVKRSTSQHSISNHPVSRSSLSMSTVLNLRRPATSHQRSADIEHSVNLNRTLELPMATDRGEGTRRITKFEDGTDDTWRPFLYSTQRELVEKTPGKLSMSIKPKDLTQLKMPVATGYPTLMLSNAITPWNFKGNSASAEPFYSSPSGFNNPIQRVTDPTVDHIKSPVSEGRRRPRQSFSFNDVASGSSRHRALSKSGNLHSPKSGTGSQRSTRNVSNPLPQTWDVLISEKPMPPRLRRKRNFTDASILTRPQTAPQRENSSIHSSQVREFQTNFIFPYSGVHRPREVTPGHLNGQTNDELGMQGPSHPQGPGSSPPVIRYSRIKRLSASTSDRASTVIGSDDTRVFSSEEEDETDFQSDSVFDSFRTRITSSSHSGRRGPNIETIFQDDPAGEKINDKSTIFDELVSPDSYLPQLTPQSSSSSHSNVNSVSTPVTVARVRDEDETPTQSAKTASRITIPPASSRSTDNWQTCQMRPPVLEDIEQDTAFSRSASPAIVGVEDGKLDVSRTVSEFEALTLVTESNAPVLTRETSGIGTRASVFDWSEQSRHERDAQDSNNRPRTVHGKQGAGARGGRVSGRKASTTVHLRSQSVPVSRDSPPSIDSRPPALKFGTWGLGHKGVSEDWDGDFDFGDSDDFAVDDDDGNSDLGGHQLIMKVPQAIMESQANVHGQFSQVQELTLLVEELKRLRVQGNMLHIVQGPSNGLWKEAEGIVNLATLEDNENNFSPPLSLTSHLSFDDFDFDTSPSQRTRKRNDSDVRRSPLAVWPNPGPNSTPPRRRDAVVKAKSVLETIYQHRESSDPRSSDSHVYSPQKLTFDTQSLRDLVIRAGAVTRALKEVIRRAEGVATVDEPPLPLNPPFSRIFETSS